MNDSGEVESVTLNEFGNWIVETIEQFLVMLQNISSPLFMMFLGISAFVLVIGIVLGSNRLRGAGGGGLVFAIIAFLIVRNADTVIAVLEGVTNNAP
ncbi:hypothetical protein [Lentibacillus salinarum]|uniref:Uncharacterized protein n=1 Tax=Lentibacillus salinarum TaxID=446820 RepID=A0ABW3ZXH1_9BACI